MVDKQMKSLLHQANSAGVHRVVRACPLDVASGHDAEGNGTTLYPDFTQCDVLESLTTMARSWVLQ